MFKKIWLALLLATPLCLFGDGVDAQALEKQMWENIKNHKWSDLENRIAPCFQAALYDGVRSKEQYMSRAKALNLSDYILSNFTVTQRPGVMIVSYDAAVAETTEGKRLASNATRLSVWQEDNGNWQWIAHAILIPVPVSE